MPFISNFNVTLGQKVALSFLLQKGQKGRKKRLDEEKENSEVPESARKRRESKLKAEGFRIRRKVN